MANLSCLPAELLVRIFSLCDKDSRAALTMVNVHFRSIIESSADVERKTLRILDLPSELLLIVLSYLTRSELGATARVCRRFRDLSYADCLWMREASSCLATNGRDDGVCVRTAWPLSAREKVRVCRNWTRAQYVERALTCHTVRYMPRIQLESDLLWVSWGKCIWAHPRSTAAGDGSIALTTTRVLKGHTDDVSRFVVKDGLVVSGGRDRTLVAWNAHTGDFAFANRYCHQGEVSAVDVTPAIGGNRLILTGSRDKTAKIWRVGHGDDGYNRAFSSSLVSTVTIGDRIWSLSASPSGTRVAIGSAGLSGVPALHVMDVSATSPQPLGADTKRGAGVLDLLWQCENTFLSCGYDATSRVWDIRLPPADACVSKMEEPFDEAIYCMATDGNMTLVCGTARHGLVRLWDLRRTARPVQKFYSKHVNHQSSPVYSVAFDMSNLYVALDQCLNLLSFAGLNR